MTTRYPAGAAPRDPTAAKLGRGQLNHWIAAGHVTPAGGRGRGRVLLWTDDEWRVVRIAGHLAAQGFTPAAAVEIARSAAAGRVRIELTPGLSIVIAPSFASER